MPCTIGPLSPTISPTKFVIGATVDTIRKALPETVTADKHLIRAISRFSSDSAGLLIFSGLKSPSGCVTELEEQLAKVKQLMARAAVRRFLRIGSGYLWRNPVHMATSEV
jgi:hypothetical protein